MAHNNSGKGSKGARSLGAAAGSGKPSGAILDDTAEVLLQRKQRFKAWREGHRNTSLKDAEEVGFKYPNSPKR